NDPALCRHVYLFINKAWGYGDPNPDHYFLAPNYRLSELQGACALAQLPKLVDVVRRRVELANRMAEILEGIPGVETPHVEDTDMHVFWKYCLRIDPL